jgi:hypothetical protein
LGFLGTIQADDRIIQVSGLGDIFQVLNKSINAQKNSIKTFGEKLNPG